MELSPKQWRIAELVSEGMRNKEIARIIGNTESVVKNYIRVIFDETGMNNRLELALWYVAREVEKENENYRVVTVPIVAMSNLERANTQGQERRDHVSG